MYPLLPLGQFNEWGFAWLALALTARSSRRPGLLPGPAHLRQLRHPVPRRHCVQQGAPVR
jgi:hypothetical protein